ncbi:MAG TPA: hypothetical protein VGX50_07595 [Longimicrobium sp.]|jgi:hypothetical protein|nr:hypothetical protein [Longimicrobium sp.]
MKIRGLIAGLLVALAIGGCTGSATEPDTSAIVPAAFDDAPPPPPPDTTNRGGGTMGTGT